MPRSAGSLVRLIPAPEPELPDVQLLRAFVVSRGEDAFEELVRRYGPMVFATCRRLLGNSHDAEDAFQAVFLVLARKAQTVRGENLAAWLYTVAVRTARGVRIMRDRRRKHTRSSQLTGNGQQSERAASLSPETCLLTTELASVIDEELARLPDHYREAVVLCELRGLSRKQAASALGIPEGTLSSRLAAAKRKLAANLSARGLAAPAVLALALAPASVSAQLVRSAVAVARGVAAPVVNAAASAVVKAMLFDQLKAVTLAAGILLSVVCGGLAMTSSGTGSEPPTNAPAPRNAEEVAKLVEQLGSEDFANREDATKKLRQLGLQAEAILRVGLRSENPEVRERVAKLLIAVRADARDALVRGFNPTNTDEPDHPIWRRFKSIAGNDLAARKLFAEIIADTRRLKMLDDADRDSDKAGELYAAELERWYAYTQQLLNRQSPEPPYPEALAVMYLGTYPTSTGKAKEGWRWEGHLFIDTWGELMKSPVGPAVKRIFASWLEFRDNPATRERGFAIAANYRVKEALPLARVVLANEKEEAEQRAQSALMLGVLGTEADMPLLRKMAESKLANKPFRHFNVILSGEQELRSVWNNHRFGGKNDPEEWTRAFEKADIRTCNITVADCAWAAAVRLSGGKPQDMGFLWPQTVRGGKTDDDWFVTLPSHGFPNEAARAAAYAKAKAFLDEHKNPEPKKDEPKQDPAVLQLVEQLGAADFADREEAQKALRTLGHRAEAALKEGLKSESPEIRERAAKLLIAIRKDMLATLVKDFDPAKETQPEHALWERFQTIAGNTPASRELFARIIKNADWVRRLDAGLANGEVARQMYREALIEVGKRYQSNMLLWTRILVWPCDRDDEVAYLMLLGSYPETASARGPGADPDFMRFMDGEGRIPYARGLTLGLRGKRFSLPPTDVEPIAPPAGTDRVFARLLKAWLDCREPTQDVVPPCLWLAATHGAKEILPLARIIAEDKFQFDREPSPQLYAAALAVVARFGTPADVPLFERHFKNEMVVATLASEDPKSNGSRGSAQLRDVAAGLTLVLLGEDPAEHGFSMAKGRREKLKESWYEASDFGFLNGDDKSRAAAHAKVKAFLDKQPKVEPRQELKKEPKADPAVLKLIEQLGAADFADREDAQKALRAKGLKVEAAIKAGLQSESPEIRERCAKLLPAIRDDALKALAKDFDPTKEEQPDHPLWQRFKTLAGNDASSRHLFAEIISDPVRLQLLDTANREPDRAGELYEREVTRLAKDTQKGVERGQPRKEFGGFDPDDPTPKPADVAVGFFLGTFPVSAKAFPDPKWSDRAPYGGVEESCGLFHNPFQQGLDLWRHSSVPEKVTVPAFRRLFTAWLATRQNPGSICLGFDHARIGKVSETLLLARAILADKNQPAKVRASALPILGAFGEAKDEPLVLSLLNEKATYMGTKYGPQQKDATAQIRDIALAVRLILRGKNPAEFGFPGLADHSASLRDVPLYPHDLGFFDDASREATHTKVNALLAKQAKKDTARKEADPTPEELIKRLGSADFDEREAAKAALLELGEPALKALKLAAANDTSAEIRLRAADLVKVISSPTFGQLRQFKGHTGLVAGVAFFPSGDKIVTSGYDATYRIWDAKTGKELDQRSTGTKESQVGGPVAISPDGKRIIARYFAADADTGKFLFGLEGHTGRIARITYSTDGKRILTASHDGTVRVWDAEGKELQRIDAHMGTKVPVTSSGMQLPKEQFINRGAWDAAFSRDGTKIVSGGVDGTVRVWDTDSGNSLQTLKIDRLTTMAVTFMPDGKRVVSGGSDGLIRIWDATGKEVAKFEGHTAIISALAVTQDGKLLISAGYDKTVRVWDLATGTELRCFRGHTAVVQCVCVSPDGKSALSGGEDNTARLWALPAGAK
jgi:RNA polymerase sigma factor (sigma-70 family)